MSYNFPGQPGAANMNLDQPFSGYSNGSISYNHHNSTIQRVQTMENGGETSQPSPQGDFDVSNHQIRNAMNRSTPPTQDYQQQSRAQHLMQHAQSESTLCALPADFNTNGFWAVRAELTLPGGQIVSGRFGDIYVRYAAARKDIWKHYNVCNAQQVPNNRHTLSQRVNTQTMAAGTNTANSTKPQDKRPKLTPASRKPGTAATAMNPVPAYAPDDDLSTPQKCRDYLAYIDPVDVHALEFENDDWEDVLENKKHVFIGQMFEAFTHPYAQDPPAGITLIKEAREKYYKQQDTQATKVLGLLQTAPQIKGAKALCSILFDAAVYVHQVGVPKEAYDGYQYYTRKERQVDRKFRLDLESVCSVRLEKIVAGIKYNKLIAMDVLEQTNFHRMARDPSFYLVEKFTYLRSNKTRQDHIDRHNKQDEEDAHFGAQMGSRAALHGMAGKKRMREVIEESVEGMESDEASDEENMIDDDFGDEEFEQPFKRVRR